MQSSSPTKAEEVQSHSYAAWQPLDVFNDMSFNKAGKDFEASLARKASVRPFISYTRDTIQHRQSL